MKTRKLLLLAVLIACIGGIPTASAGTIELTCNSTNCDNGKFEGLKMTFTTSLNSGTNYTGVMTFDFNGWTESQALSGLRLVDFATHFAGDITGLSPTSVSPTGSSAVYTVKESNGNNCSGSTSGAICGLSNGTYVLANVNGNKIEFTFTFNWDGTQLDPPHFKGGFQYYAGLDKNGNPSWKQYGQISNDASWKPEDPPPPEVPEPGTMVLLGSGMLGAGRMLRRRFQK